MDLHDPLLPQKMLLILGGSFVICALVILTQHWHGKHSLDHDLVGAQKIHTHPVPRIGGIGLFFGLVIAVISGYMTQGISYPTTLTLLASGIPVFAAGLVEDLTKKVSVRARLLASFASAALAVWLLDIRLTDVDTPWLDLLLRYPGLSVLFTIFAVGGVTHSVNIIDGLNGLAAGAVSIMLAGLAAIAWMHGDALVMKLCLWGIAALLGFMCLNFPFGKIFLGDGGAYLAGFWLAECAVMLLARNPSVSTWTVLLCCIYPVFETGYSMYRRHLIHKVPSGQPDMGHMHQLLLKRVQAATDSSLPSWLLHGITVCHIWFAVLLCQIIAGTMPDQPPRHIWSALIACAAYVGVHRRLYRPACTTSRVDSLA